APGGGATVGAARPGQGYGPAGRGRRRRRAPTRQRGSCRTELRRRRKRRCPARRFVEQTWPARSRGRSTGRNMFALPAQYTLRSRRVVLPSGVRPADVHVADGRILAVPSLPTPSGPLPPTSDLRDLGDLVLMPGIVDTHVHVNEPGRTEWEGFETAGAAALAGGVTTIVDMPLNSVP